MIKVNPMSIIKFIFEVICIIFTDMISIQAHSKSLDMIVIDWGSCDNYVVCCSVQPKMIFMNFRFVAEPKMGLEPTTAWKTV